MSAGVVSSYTMDARGNAAWIGDANSLALFWAPRRALARIAAARLPTTDPIPLLGQKTAPYSAQAPATKQAVDQAASTVKAIYDGVLGDVNADASAIIEFFQANVVAAVTTQQVGNVPSGGPGTPIDPPSSEVDVPLGGLF